MEYLKLKPILAAADSNGIGKAISVLKALVETPKIGDLMKQWDVKKHDVFNETIRKKRSVIYDTVIDNVATTREELEDVNRIGIPLQKYIVGKAVSFLFGNPVEMQIETEQADELKLMFAIRKILEDNKIDSQNMVVAESLFKSTQVAEIWYAEESEEHEDYGFKTNIRIKMSIFSPWDGSALYPYKDPKGNLVAFSREFKVKDENNTDRTNFEVYTAEEYIRWEQSATGWVQETKVPSEIKKIPVAFAQQEDAEWADVQAAIARLEFLLSNHGDTNDYNGSPTIVVKGKVESIGKKGEAGKVMEIDGEKGDAKYMSWDSAPESIKMEIENKFKIIHTYTNTPDLSFEAIKGMGAISGVALRFFLFDAHLKVMDKRKTFDPYLTRRLNIIKSMVAVISPDLKAASTKLKIKNIITPYTIDDPLERIKVLVEANGGNAVMSQIASFMAARMTSDPAADFEDWKKEDEKRNLASVSEPTF